MKLGILHMHVQKISVCSGGESGLGQLQAGKIAGREISRMRIDTGADWKMGNTRLT